MILVIAGRNPTKLLLNDGIQLYAPKNHPLIEMVFDIYIQNIYSSTDFKIEQNDIIIDVGANIGIFSLFAANKTHNLVYAYEPFDMNIKYLRHNIKTNGVKNIVVNEVAVSDNIGNEYLFLTRNPAGNILHKQKTDNKNQIEVPTTTLQAIFEKNNINQVGFLKMDCEGSEGVILISTPIRYLKKIKKIVIEFHDNVSVLKHHEIQNLLKEAGFSTSLTWDNKTPYGFIYAYLDENRC
jgi:FkbM family methyltransferase